MAYLNKSIGLNRLCFAGLCAREWQVCYAAAASSPLEIGGRLTIAEAPWAFPHSGFTLLDCLHSSSTKKIRFLLPHNQCRRNHSCWATVIRQGQLQGPKPSLNTSVSSWRSLAGNGSLIFQVKRNSTEDGLLSALMSAGAVQLLNSVGQDLGYPYNG